MKDKIPDPEVRTPPRARPRGPALKVRSVLTTPPPGGAGKAKVRSVLTTPPPGGAGKAKGATPAAPATAPAKMVS